MIVEAEKSPEREAQRRELDSYVERRRGAERREAADGKAKEQEAGKDMKELIHTLLDKTIAFRSIFGKVAGGALPGLFLSQAYYWTGKGARGDGWFFKSREEWSEETTMTRREQETARRILVERGILEEMKEGLPRRLYFRVNMDNLFAAIQAAAREDAQNAVGTKRAD